MNLEFLKNKTVFLGNIDIASQVSDLRHVLQEAGVKCITLHNREPNPIIKEKVHINLYKLKNSIPIFRPHRFNYWLRKNWSIYIHKLVQWWCVKRCDVFIFFWNSFNGDFSDIELLKRKNKRIIFCFVGDDVRWFFAQKQEFEKYQLKHIEYDNDYDYSLNGLRERLRRIRNSERFATIIFSRLDQAQLQLKPYYRFHMMVDTKKIKPNFNQNKIPVVVHAPSNKVGKGSKYVTDAINELKLEGIEFVFKQIEGLENNKLIQLLASADIVIDQMICPGSGKIASEALASGKVVISHMAYSNYPQNIDLDYPVVDANVNNIKEVLKQIVLDVEFRKKRAIASRKFAEEVLDYRHFIKKIDKILAQNEVEYDYIPSFFNDDFISESNEALYEYNKWNKFVENCDWYKKFVKPKRRAGLEF